MRGKKRLFCAIPHSPAFDSCFPLLERLQSRGKVEPFILLGPRLRSVEPRAEVAVKAANVPYVPASLMRIEVLAARDILRADAVLTHSDPRAYGGKFRPRDAVVLRSRKPTIFVQHGMVQAGLHYAGAKPVWAFHADLMLIWTALQDPDAPFFAPAVADRLTVTGLIKANRLAPAPGLDALARSLGNWRQRVLICHNFGFESPLYPQTAQAAAFAEWARIADARPDTLFILRSHRGKRHPANEAMVAALTANRPNIILSERHDGLMRMATINDVMALVDRVISHPSTVVLDAIYDGKPIAVLNASQPALACLPRADSAEEIARFVDDPAALDRSAPLRALFGVIDDNLDIAARAVENHLEGL